MITENDSAVKEIVFNLLELKCPCLHEPGSSSYTLLYRDFQIKINEHNIFVNNVWFPPSSEAYKEIKKYYDKEKLGERNLLKQLKCSIVRDLRKPKLEKLKKLK